MRLHGHCHCGALEFNFETSFPAEDLPVRACACRFCRLHGAVTATDAAGTVDITVRKPDLSFYRFGLKTADYWLCRQCGVYLCAVVEIEGQSYATLNIATVEGIDDTLLSAPQPVSYEDETFEERLARRKSRWTPVRKLNIS